MTYFHTLKLKKGERMSENKGIRGSNVFALGVLIFMIMSVGVSASTGLAFEAGMDAFLSFFTGKFVFILSALAVIVSVGMFAFNHDAMTGVMKGFIGLLFVLGVMGNIINLLNMFGLTNTGILI